MTVVEIWRSGVASVVLIGIALVVLTVAQVHVRRDAVVAMVRAGLQLTLVAVVIAWVFAHPEGAVLYLGVMLVAATITSVRRIGAGVRRAPAIAVAIAAGGLSAVVPVMASGALDFRAETTVPFAAQIIGGSMMAVSLTGTRMRDDVAVHWGEVEAWLALGGTPRTAVADFGRRAVARALIPALDQTRSAGLVTLPGAFVGLLLGGASPAEAAQIQLLVLVGLLAAEAVAAVVTSQVLSGWLGSARPQALGY